MTTTPFDRPLRGRLSLASLGLTCALALAAGCGGGSSGGGGKKKVTFNYPDSPATYTEGFAITDSAANGAGSLSSFTVAPALPAGMSLDTATGTVSGTPFFRTPAADYVVTGVKDGGGNVTATFNIGVNAAFSRSLYVANSGDSSVSSFQVGSLHHSGFVPSPSADPNGMVSTPNGEFVYVSHAGAADQVEIFSADPVTGRLTHTGFNAVTGDDPSAMAMFPSGSYLYVANSADNDIRMYTVEATGELTAAPQDVSAGNAVSSLSLDWSGSFLFATNGGDNEVQPFTIDAATGDLTAGTAVSTGTDPRFSAAVTTANGNFLYVANGVSNDISVYDYDPVTGALTEKVFSPIAAGLEPNSMATTFDGSYLYVANRTASTVSAFSIDATTGNLTSVAAAAATSAAPTALTMDPDDGTLYVCCRDANEVEMFAIQPDGSLVTDGTYRTRSTPVGMTFARGLAGMQFSSNYAYVINQGADDDIEQFSVNVNGGAVSLSSSGSEAAADDSRGFALNPDGDLFFVGSSTGFEIRRYSRDVQTGALTPLNPATAIADPVWDMMMDPSGRFLYAVHTDVGDSLFPYTINQSTGELTAGAPVGLGLDSRSGDFDPTGQFLYVADAFSGVVYQFTVDQDTGVPTAMAPPTVAAGGGCNQVRLHPTGRFAYAVNETGESVSMFTVNASTGSLAPTVPASIATGVGTAPTEVRMSPNGAFLFVTYSGTDEVAPFTIDTTTGLLTAGTPLQTRPNPSSLTVSADGAYLLVTNKDDGSTRHYLIDSGTGALSQAGEQLNVGTDPAAIFVSRDVQ